MSGIGAWPHLLNPNEDDRSDPSGRDANRLLAFKRELIYNGYADGIIPTLPFYGTSAVSQCKKFQSVNSLIADGIIGPRTARALFKKRIRAAEVRYGVPDPWLGKLATEESANDPVAQGFSDPNDEGLVQIHLAFNPDITINEAWDPAFSIPWAASKVASNITFCHGNIKGGIAAYNIGRWFALQWTNAGQPASGGPLLGGVDSYVRATQYVNLVENS